MVCDVQLNSDIASFKALGDNLSFKTAVQQHIVGVESGAPKYIYRLQCFKIFCIGKAFVGS